MTISMWPRHERQGPEDRELPPQWAADYVLLQILRESGQATVYLCRRRPVRQSLPSERVVLRKSPAFIHRRQHQMSLQELSELKHDNIVQSLRAPIEVDRRWWWEALEYCERGSVAQWQQAADKPEGWRNTFGPLQPTMVKAVVVGVSRALRYLHDERNLLHTDVKPDNILVRLDNSIALGDFGSAVSRANPPSLALTSGRTPQFSPSDDGRLSPSWDWAQLGFTVMSMVTGMSNPSSHYREVDFSSLDPPISLLLRGLLNPEPEDRWGYADVARWLSGDSPPIRGEDIGLRRRRTDQPFLVDFGGYAYESPADLSEAMARNWVEAVRLVQSPKDGKPYLAWLADRLAAISHPGVTEMRAFSRQQVGAGGSAIHPDVLLARVISRLHRSGTPRYPLDAAGDRPETFELTRSGLADLAGRATEATRDDEADQAARTALHRIYDLGILPAFADSEGFEWLRDVDQEWRTSFRALRRDLARAAQGVTQARAAYQEALKAASHDEDVVFEFDRSDWEVFATDGDRTLDSFVKAQLLRACVDPGHAQRLHSEADRSLRSSAVSQAWFADLAGNQDVPRPGPPSGPRTSQPSGSSRSPGDPMIQRRRTLWRRMTRLFRRRRS
jgi:serine/threonine protein kinase